MKNLKSDHMHDAIRQAVEEVSRRRASGKLNGSGRHYT